MWQQRTFTLRFIKNKVLLKTKEATYILGACIKKGEKMTAIESIVTDCQQLSVHGHCRVLGLKAYRLFAKNTRQSTFWRGQCWSLFIDYIPSGGKDAFRADWGSRDGKIFLCHLGDVRVSPRAQSFPPHERILLSRYWRLLFIHRHLSLKQQIDVLVWAVRAIRFSEETPHSS